MKFYPMMQFRDNYLVSTYGDICNKNGELVPTYKDGYRRYVLIDDRQYFIDELMWKMFIGELLGKIEYKDCNSDNISIKNLYTALEIEVISNKLITINSIEFSQIPGYDNYYISKNGTVFSKKRPRTLFRKKLYAKVLRYTMKMSLWKFSSVPTAK